MVGVVLSTAPNFGSAIVQPGFTWSPVMLRVTATSFIWYCRVHIMMVLTRGLSNRVPAYSEPFGIKQPTPRVEECYCCLPWRQLLMRPPATISIIRLNVHSFTRISPTTDGCLTGGRGHPTAPQKFEDSQQSGCSLKRLSTYQITPLCHSEIQPD